MKFATRFVVPALLSVAAVGAFASEITPEAPFVSTANRAEVMAEGVAALRAGAIDAGNVTHADVVVASNLTREQVRAEAVAAQRLGLISAGEVQVQPTAAQLEQVRMAGIEAVQGSSVAQGNALTSVR